jgi:hypothetical protein
MAAAAAVAGAVIPAAAVAVASVALAFPLQARAALVERRWVALVDLVTPFVRATQHLVAAAVVVDVLRVQIKLVVQVQVLVD